MLDPFDRNDQPVVYLVDDDPQLAAVDGLEAFDVSASWLHPLEVAAHHLETATLLAVDEYFDLRHETYGDDLTPLSPNLPISTVPQDGLALAAVLRSASKPLRRGRQPIGITLRTGQLDELTVGLPRGVRQPLVAAAHDLEWVVAKQQEQVVSLDQSDTDPLGQVATLAKALFSYPSAWSSRTARETGLRWLSVPSRDWESLAIRQALQCRPPIEVASTSQHGLAWVRWLAQRILPFPTFLLSVNRTATLLGITGSSLLRILGEDSSVADSLRTCLYDGPLRGLQGVRFWRAGIHHLIGDLVGPEDLDEPREIGDAICSRTSLAVPLDMFDPIVCINRDYQETEPPVERSSAERLVPDGWPAYADAAWGKKEDVDQGEMVELLVPKLA
ncbi:hypothetical protein Val02_85530 [Virgisporangium aliadipatigenens]|uniref:Uncharacterized protein n=1 Tax=Virgisporangium aliadipatigenens TaxID=741659 RepID=A0A8J3YWA8_9ACTN|nr:hypothetical protein [Virgisporangium aliadipatigenens]GIJ51667.1 hypothetical protein Val02_85530 [Virgisporangium aliadipatigenens]